MLKIATASLLVLCALHVSSCTSFKTSNGHMSIRDEQIALPEKGQALFVFERDNARVAEWYALNLWEITNRDPKLVGLLHGTMKAAWSVDPGEHDFMIALGGQTQILRTNVVAGRTYFVALDHNQWSRRGPAAYKFVPVRSGEENPMTADRIGIFNDGAKEWELEALTSAKTHMQEAYTQWDSYSEEDQAYFSMRPEDGR